MLRELPADFSLSQGAHDSFDEGACLVEAASWVAGEPFSDYPQCVCPVIGAFCRAWNDALDDDTRDRLLKPYIVRIVGTASTPEVEDRRAFLAADWVARTFTPAWLRRAGLNDDAAALEALPELSTFSLCEAAIPTIGRAKQQADAARDAAWDAAGAAAWAAARDAARDAAGAAAWAALADTVADLQRSALILLDRMIDESEPRDVAEAPPPSATRPDAAAGAPPVEADRPASRGGAVNPQDGAA